MRYTTINKILACYPCDPDKVIALAGDIDYDEPISFKQIYDAVSFEDALWCIGALDYDDEMQAFALRCSRLVEDFDKSGSAKKCNDTLERYLQGNASLEALDNAVKPAANDAWTAAKAANDAANDAASDAAWSAWSAAKAAARSAMSAARSAMGAERAAWYARDAGMVKQIESDFLSTFCED